MEEIQSSQFELLVKRLEGFLVTSLPEKIVEVYTSTQVNLSETRARKAEECLHNSEVRINDLDAKLSQAVNQIIITEKRVHELEEKLQEANNRTTQAEFCINQFNACNNKA